MDCFFQVVVPLLSCVLLLVLILIDSVSYRYFLLFSLEVLLFSRCFLSHISQSLHYQITRFFSCFFTQTLTNVFYSRFYCFFANGLATFWNTDDARLLIGLNKLLTIKPFPLCLYTNFPILGW